MKDIPILFSAPMVRALLAGTKTQTRRILTPRLVRFADGTGRSWRPSEEQLAEALTEALDFREISGVWTWTGKAYPYQNADRTTWLARLGYEISDRLWVRETVRADELESGLDGVRYLADDAFIPIENSQEAADRWLALRHYRGKRGATVPPIHMPRWASRLTLIVKDVRVERLHAIDDVDAMAEGVKEVGSYPDADGDPRIDPLATGWMQKVFSADPSEIRTEDDLYSAATSPRSAFARLWRKINGDEAWTSNPWVVVVTFEAVKANIDAIERAAA